MTAESNTGARGSIELIDVTKRYGAVVAVDSINLTVKPGEFLSLLGPSGCGKTTTLRMLAGFEQPDGGHILVNGKEVQGVPPHKRDVNTVFQHYALFPHMTVAENVAYGLKQKGVPKSEVATVSPKRWTWCRCPSSLNVNLDKCQVDNNSASQWRERW